jgi:UDP-N-acetylmuramoylalanine--D-glutamate ligase
MTAPVVNTRPTLRDKNVVVVGLGKSGRAAAELCHARGARVTATDAKDAAAIGPDAEALQALGVRLELGGHRDETFLGADLIVLSPGVPALPAIQAARARGVSVTGELELASRFLDATLVAITGTNGKSTTTSLAGAISQASGRPTFVGGNLGDPLCHAVGTAAGASGGICVVEVSSFQAETFDTFHPRAAVCLNVTADHLDRYPSMQAYADAKARLFATQGPEDVAVLNADDPWCKGMAAGTRARVAWLSTSHPVEPGGYVDGADIVLHLDGSTERYPIAELQIVGRHNLENAIAAFLLCRAIDLPVDVVRRAAAAFKPLAHRMERVAEIRGVTYYDDSKGTNVGAVAASITGFPRPVVLIAGGRDKGGDYGPLREALATCGRGLVLIGEAADRIAGAMGDVTPIQRATTMDDAVRRATSMARPGDAVVLSPACSSFDMFRNYEHRAQVFRAAVEALG